MEPCDLEGIEPNRHQVTQILTFQGHSIQHQGEGTATRNMIKSQLCRVTAWQTSEINLRISWPLER